jgi:hypothetical protein
MGIHRAQLHLGHHGAAQGRGLSPPRGLPCAMANALVLADGAVPGLPDHRAALSLQRLVPHLDGAHAGRHGRLLPRHHRQGDLRRHRRRRRHPFRRRAHRAEHHHQRPRKSGPPPLFPHRRGLHRRRPAPRRHAGRNRAAGLQRHPGLRPDRNLRPRHRMHLETGLGHMHRRRPRRLKARTGVAMPMLEGAEVHDTQGNPVPRDGRIWARSPCAATW